MESEDELRPGMAVLISPCRSCRKPEVRIVASVEYPGERTVASPEGDKVVSCASVRWAAPRCDGVTTYTAIGRNIREGRAFRLRDLPPDQAEETSAPREKERTDAK